MTWLWLSRLSIVVTVLIGVWTVYEKTGRQISILFPWFPFIVFASITVFLNIYYQRKREEAFINPFKDLDVVYKIKVTNQTDGEIERWITFSNNFFLPLEKREHFLFGTENKEDILLEAFDERGRSLGIRSIDDKPNHKVFEVIFIPPIQPKETFKYAFKYSWKGLFPSNEEWYEGHDYSRKITYELHIPAGMSLQELHCEEYIGGGKHIVCKEEKPTEGSHLADGTTKYILHIKKRKRNSTTTVLKWSKRTN